MSDPIFAAIETYRAAWAALEKGCERPDDESTPETEAEFDRLNDAAEEAACTLADTQPTNHGGRRCTLAARCRIRGYVRES